jgi:hypothetical protein
MQKVLKANFLYGGVDEDSDVLMVGFADDEFDTKEYILLQKTLVPGQKDKELGLDKVHIEYNDQSRSTYAGILNIVMYNDGIEIRT